MVFAEMLTSWCGFRHGDSGGSLPDRDRSTARCQRPGCSFADELPINGRYIQTLFETVPGMEGWTAYGNRADALQWVQDGCRDALQQIRIEAYGYDVRLGVILWHFRTPDLFNLRLAQGF
jgi:hypothetical protein